MKILLKINYKIMAFVLLGLFSALVVGISAEYNHDYAKQMSYYAGASYCSPTKLRDWSCGPCTNASSSFDVVATFSIQVMGEKTNVFHGKDAEGKVIISFQGTHSAFELIDELTHFGTVDYEWYDLPGVELNQFFHDSYAGYREQLLNGLAGYMTKSDKVVVTGHSLGGAVAAICALDLILSDLSTGENLELITFGEPRVGNSEFSAVMDKYVPQSYRVVWKKDIIPHVPLQNMIISKYLHHSEEIWYEKSDSYQECGKDENPDCSNSVNDLFRSIPDHLFYFGWFISECTLLEKTFLE